MRKTLFAIFASLGGNRKYGIPRPVKQPAAVNECKDGRTRMPLHFDPAGSFFVVFRDPPRSEPYLSVSRDGVMLIRHRKTLDRAAITRPALSAICREWKNRGSNMAGRRLSHPKRRRRTHPSRSKTPAAPFQFPALGKCCFPQGLGAPPEISLDDLQPLSKNPEFGVRHFSGTMTYAKTFSLDYDLADGQRRVP